MSKKKTAVLAEQLGLDEETEKARKISMRLPQDVEDYFKTLAEKMSHERRKRIGYQTLIVAALRKFMREN